MKNGDFPTFSLAPSWTNQRQDNSVDRLTLDALDLVWCSVVDFFRPRKNRSAGWMEKYGGDVHHIPPRIWSRNNIFDEMSCFFFHTS